MFIATRQELVAAPAEPNVADRTHRAPLERDPRVVSLAINIWSLWDRGSNGATLLLTTPICKQS
jgi:hypothetical protein